MRHRAHRRFRYAPPRWALRCGALLVASTLLVSAAPGQAARIVERDGPRPVAGSLEAVYAEGPVLLWSERDPDGVRARASRLEAPGATRLGPPGPGEDRHLAAAAGSGALWVAATRATADGRARLWVQRRRRGRWEAPERVPRTGRVAEHPAVSPGDDGLWVVWIAGGESSSSPGSRSRRGPEGRSGLRAARLTPAGWGPVESLPAAVGEPMPPAVDVDAAGRPTVVWAAGDPEDAEIWLSRRLAAGWSPPERISDNRVPDLFPRIRSSGGRTVVAWSRFAGDGYRPTARVASRAGAWGPPRQLDREAGGRPRLLATAGGFVATWGVPRLGLGRPVERTLLRSATLLGDGEGWTAPRDLAVTEVAGHAAAVAPSGRALLAWARSPRGLRVVERGPPPGRAEAPNLPADPGARFESIAPSGAAEARVEPASQGPIPRIYMAFGDSITQGIVIEDGVARDAPGYPPKLEEMLPPLIVDPSVPNRGVGGEGTADGLARIDEALVATRAEAGLVLEGTNDVFQKVDPDTIAFNLQAMMERVNERGAQPFLSLLQPRNEEGFGGRLNERIDEVNERLPQVAEETGAILVDMHAPFLGRPELYSNVNHPNEEGYRVMAEVWFDAIRPHVLSLTNRGDVDDSGRVDGVDLVRLAFAFGSLRGEDRYRRRADVNLDDMIDGFDLSILAEFFGETLDEGADADGG